VSFRTKRVNKKEGGANKHRFVDSVLISHSKSSTDRQICVDL
jgi:hypothetical protein